MIARRGSWGRVLASRSGGCVLALVAVAVGCSSSSNIPSGSGSSGSGSSGSPSDAGGAEGADPVYGSTPTGGIVTGSGNGMTAFGSPYVEGSDPKVKPLVTSGACPIPTGTITIGTKIAIPATAPANQASPGGPGNLYTWTIGMFTVANGKFTGTTRLCATVTPPIALTMAADTALMVPSGMMGSVWALQPNGSWNPSNPDLPNWPTTGSLPSFAAGTTTTVDAHVDLLGIKQTSPLGMMSSAWPAQMGYMIPTSDLNDPDHDMNNGFTGKYDNATGFFNSVASASGYTPVDEIYLASRTAYSLSGTIQPNCVVTKGTVNPLLYDSAIIGCHVTADPESGAPRDCTTGTATSEAAYIDTFDPVYQLMPGTYEQRQLEDGATCTDVLTALP